MARLVVVAVLACMLSGCAGTVGSMVRESDKDPEARFDGVYLLEVDHPGGRQDAGPGWFMNCQPRKFMSEFSIKDSKVMWPVNNDSVVEGYIDSDGKFRLEQALDDDVTGTSTLSDGSVTLVLQGNVSDGTMKGLLLFAVAQFINRGCSYPVKYSRK